MPRKQKGAEDGAQAEEASAEQAQQQDQGAEDGAQADAVDDGLVEVRKGGETLRVHPTCLRAHHDAGWRK